jgi:hypothetical protein
MPPDKPPNGTLQRLPFQALTTHLEMQVRGKTIPAIVNRYRLAMKNGDTFPPMKVADVNGALVLFDGFHRRAALEALGEWEGEFEVIPCRSLDVALWWAFDANQRHGQPLKAKASQGAFQAYMRAGLNEVAGGGLRSYRELAQAIPGVSYSTIRRWMERDFPAVFEAMAGANDEAEGGSRPSPKSHPGTAYELTVKAVELLDSAEALMQGVAEPELRQAVADKAAQLRQMMMLTEGGALEEIELGDDLSLFH